MKTFETLLHAYRVTLKANRRWSQSKDYALDQLNKELGQWPTSDLTKANLINWALSSPRAPSTKRVLLATLSDVLYVATALWSLPVDRLAARDAIQALSLAGAVKRSEARAQRVTDDDLQLIAGNWSAQVDNQLVNVLVDTAMRVGELGQLHLSDVTETTIHIRKRKGGKSQTIPNLSPWLRDRAGRNEPASPYTGASISQAFRSAAKRSNLANIKTHDLRHEGISRLFERGWSIPQVAAVSGHNSWENLKRYTHINPETPLELS